jgi:hypothetical protein
MHFIFQIYRKTTVMCSSDKVNTLKAGDFGSNLQSEFMHRNIQYELARSLYNVASVCHEYYIFKFTAFSLLFQVENNSKINSRRISNDDAISHLRECIING